ncbi:MAG: NAD-dependent protein deacylase [Acutalibacteraceae bacterium]
MQKINELKRMINESKSICVFTGAGISCPSGIPDFRSADGLYNQKSNTGYTPEQIISHSFFVSHTDMFYEFYKSKMIYENAQPNIAHKYFADLEKQGKSVSVVTQNIDGLHQKAGSKNVLELHGSIYRNYCVKCGAFYGLEAVVSQKGVPVCSKCGGVIKPQVVLYEEPLDEKTINSALNAIENADLMIVIGTSLTVYPAASYIRFFRGNNLVLINKTKTTQNQIADLEIYDDVANVINQLLDE